MCLSWLKKLFGGKKEEQPQGQTQESETNTPEHSEHSGCGEHCDSSEKHGEGAGESSEEERPQ